MLLLISNLIKTLRTTVNRALEWLLPSVDAHVIEQTLRFLEEFSTTSVVARVHSRLSLSIGVWLSDEFELGEKS